MKTVSLITLLNEIKGCDLCKQELPFGANPIVQASKEAELLIIGQAPGIRVHESGIPWNDASGNRLRKWLEISPEDFYNPNKIAIMPMGFCYPGRGQSGDLPPSRLCAPTWHQQLLDHLPNIKTILLIGIYAQNYYLADTPFFKRYKTLTERVKAVNDCPAPFFVLPHPSPRNQGWLKKNPWFESDTLTVIRKQLRSNH